MNGAKACFAAGFFLLVPLCGGCAIFWPQTDTLLRHPPPDLPNRVELDDVPFFPQDDYQCGPASLAMVLDAAGADVSPESLTPQVYLPARRGSLQVEMIAAARRHGMIAYQLAPQLHDVLREVAAGTPVVVLQNYGIRWYPVWHYAVVVAYDVSEAKVILRSGMKRRLAMPFGVFEYLWKDGDRWAMLAVPPQRLPVTATESAYTSAAVALETSGQTTAAHAAYATLLTRWPSSLAGLIGAGNVAYAEGDLKSAEAAFRHAAESHPTSAAAFNNLAQTLSDQGNFTEALAMSRRAVNLGGPLRETSGATFQAIIDRLRDRAGRGTEQGGFGSEKE